LRFVDTFKPLLIASVASLVPVVTLSGAGQRPDTFPTFVIYLGMIWIGTVSAAVVFVVPVLAAVPKLRRPPHWLSVVWGVAAASGALAVLYGPSMFMRNVFGGQWRTSMNIGLWGGTAGLCYALVAQRIRD
jgi:hypothetical protein